MDEDEGGEIGLSENEKMREELRRLGDEFLRSMRDEVDRCVLLCDVDKLHGLIRQMDIYLSYRIIRDLRERGLGEELDELCDKAGRRSEVGKDRV